MFDAFRWCFVFDLGIAVPGFGISGEQSRIQKLHCIQKLVFRNYFVVFGNYFVVFRNSCI